MFKYLSKFLIICFIALLVLFSFKGYLYNKRSETLNNINQNLDLNLTFSSSLKLAKEGEPSMQAKVGLMYLDGKGVSENHNKALYWLEKSALNMSAVGQESLAYMYLNKLGGLDDDRALFWYTKSSEQGRVSSQVNLAIIYRDGLIIQNDKKALYWFNKAAEQGSSDAQVSLAIMLIERGKTEEELKKAAFWLKEAASQGNETALNVINEYYRKKL